MLELRWRVSGCLPNDYAYKLFGAICHRLPARIHEEKSWTMSPIVGDRTRETSGFTVDGATLAIRCPLRLLPAFAAMETPQGLALGEFWAVTLSPAPTVHTLRPAANLSAARVVLRATSGAPPLSREEFQQRVVERLRDEFGVRATLRVPGATVHVGAASSLRVGGDLSHGFAVELRGLDEVASLRLQEIGLGGRVRMGCGFLVGGSR